MQMARSVRFGLAQLPVLCLLVVLPFLIIQGSAQVVENSIPPVTSKIVSALDNSSWTRLEDGVDAIRAVTDTGIAMTAFRVSPEQFDFSIVTQGADAGSRAKEIGENEGAVLVTNAGFFAQRLDGSLYPIGFMRLGGEVLSKGWESDGGILTWTGEGDLSLVPTHRGIPKNEIDALQSRPMFIEPGGRWAMASNNQENKNRTIVCKLGNGDIVLAIVTRVGISLFEAGWIMRGQNVGGFFGCDAAMALDGGRSSQVWYSGDEKYSFSGLVPVHNFLVVRAKGN